MYKVLIADDERSIRLGLTNSIPWEELGFCVAGAVLDGSEILEYLEENSIDVLLTDIKMHKMDGLTAAKEISERFPNIKIVILSGYSEIDYLHDAIRSKVVAYLNKPTDRDELKREFKKLKKILDEEKNIESERERLRNYLNESLPYMREIMFFKLVSGEASEEEETEAKMNFYGIDVPASDYHVVLFTIDDKENSEGGGSTEKRYLIFQTIVYLAREIFKSQSFFYDRSNDSIAGICKNENIIENIEALQEKISDLQEITLSAAVSRKTKSACEMKNKYDEASRAISLKVFFGNETIILYEEVSELFSESMPDTEVKAGKIIEAVFNKDEEAVLAEVSELFSESLMAEHADRICLEILFEVERVFALSDSNFSDYMKSHQKSVFDIIKFETTADKKAWLLDTLIEFSQTNSTELRRKVSKMVYDGLLYINNNYTDNNISLNSVADSLNKNPTYFSHIFKSETGKTFSKYIRDLRIEKAKQLLICSNMKVYEISRTVGYLDITTLTRIFKKVVGVGPNDYRNTNMRNDGDIYEVV